MTIDAAVEAARRKDITACLSALLDEWRETRDAALAAFIERVGTLVPAEPIASKGITKNVDERIARATDADVTTIITVVLREIRNIPRLYTAIVKLAAKSEPDPRIASALAELVRTAPFKQTDGALYGDVIEALDAIDDPRYRALILDCWRRVEPRMRHLRKDRKDGEILQRVAASVAARPAPEPYYFTAAIAEINTLLGAKTNAQKKQASDTSALLQAIYDDPLDTSLRLVYADALLEAGDPRGELITLQCNRGDGPVTKRERELLRLHARTWLGAIEPAVLKSGLEYRRGFVGRARECANKQKHEKALASQEWATVEDLDLTFVWGDRGKRFLSDRRWKALRSVWNIRSADLAELARVRDDYPWTMLAVKYADWQSISQITAFPQLAELALNDSIAPAVALRQLVGSPLTRTLRRLRAWIPSERIVIPELVAAWRASGIPELELHDNWTFTGDEDGELMRIAGDHAIVMFQTASPSLRAMTKLVEGLPPGTLRTIEIQPARITEAAWAPFAAALRAHGADVPVKP